MGRPVIAIKRLRPEADADIPLPCYMTEHASGMDVFAAVPEAVTLQPGCTVMVPTGFAVAIPPGLEIQVRPRSGLAATNGVTLVNSPGTIDADYRGEIFLAMINLSNQPHTIHRGDRVAQMVVAPTVRADLLESDSLDDTARSDGGFGHTGR
ncbi:MAG: dUTP diphosphatase [Deltaproteobacteria bacterium]|nr:dUTP diphosphatase [Deltaproteobacteria bacterium]